MPTHVHTARPARRTGDRHAAPAPSGSPPTRLDASCRGARDRGDVSIQMVLLMPALFALMFLAVQAALIYHARTVAIAAATEGARAAAGQHAGATAGIAAATGFVTAAGGRQVLPDTRVTGTRTATTATITVSGTSLSVIPGWTPAITHTAWSPVERLTSTSGEFTHPEGSGGGN